MTDLVGGPGNEAFLLDGWDNGATVDGGGGYDVLTIDYRAMQSPQITVIDGRVSALPRISLPGGGFTWDFAHPRIISFSNIEQIVFQFETVTALTVTPSDMKIHVEGRNGGRLGLSYKENSDPVSVDFSAGGSVKTIDNVTFAGFSAYAFWGGAGDDVVVGATSLDMLSGGDGNDVFDSRYGGTMTGGNGDDTYIVRADFNSFWISEYAGGGIDEIQTYTNFVTLPNAVENLVAMDDGVHHFNGNQSNNIIRGGEGYDSLFGGDGDDLIEGRGGNDDLFGGVGGDSVSYEHASAAVAVSLRTGIVTGGAGSDRLWEFENIRGSAYADMLTGDDGINVLSGLAGADQMTGLGGDDEYWVDNQGDVIVEAVGGGYDRVFAKVDYTLADNVESLTLIGRGNIDAYGNDLDNILTGNSGNNRLRGFGGEDYMAGGAGNDIYHVNSWGDQVVEAPGGGTDLIVSSISIDLLALPDVENVTLVNRWNINLNGNALDNVLAGNSGDNVIRGFGGNDVLSGGAGRDSFGFDAAPGAGDLVQITDFSVADDIILLSHDQFGPIGSGSGGWGLLDPDAFVIGNVAADANDRILYDSATGALFYDADGNGAGAAVQFALLTAGLALTSADFNVIL
ncbi:calcium-binding protein [Sphingobium yanoikuyae]|uniref:calcium-binding protein n=1 Tax=Sphingobium yanoikuyae TaxID=13690 RepID=UPI00345EC028